MSYVIPSIIYGYFDVKFRIWRADWNHTVVLDFDLFVSLFEEYYLSDDPSALGNFINGKLDFDEEDDELDAEPGQEKDPGLVDHRVPSSTSLHSMDDDLRAEEERKQKAAIKKAKEARSSGLTGSTLHLKEKVGELCDDLKTGCFCSIA